MVSDLYGALFASGRVTVAPEGGVIISSAPGRLIAWALAFIVLLIVSRWCWRHRLGGHVAPGFFFASFAIPVIVLPSIATETIQLSPTRLSIQTGLWFSPTKRDIPLSGLQGIVETQARIPQRGARRVDLYWEFYYLSTPRRRVHLPDLLEANRDPVIREVRRYGIPFRSRAP